MSLRAVAYKCAALPSEAVIAREGTVSRVSDLTIVEDARRQAAALVERETLRTGSKMAGYQAVAEMVGVSPAWLRAFVCRYPNAKPDTVILNIRFAFLRGTT